MPGRSRLRVTISSRCRVRPTDDAPLTSGEAAIAPVGEVSGRIAGRASSRIFDRFPRHSRRDEAYAHGSGEVEAHAALVSPEGFVRELGRHVGTDLVAAAANARTEVGARPLRREPGGLACRSEGCLRDAGHHASPSGVGGARRVSLSEQDRQAIRAGRGERHAARRRDGAVASREEARPIDPRDRRAVHLAHRRETGELEAQRGQHAAPVLLDRLGTVDGGAAEVQGVVGRRADAAAPRREGEKRTARGRLGRGVTPERHGGLLVDPPHARDDRNGSGERQARRGERLMGDTW